MSGPDEFAGRNYLVAGASQGIGRAVCQQLAKRGANVDLLARSDEKLRETLAGMAPGDHRLLPYDLANVDGISGCVSEVFKRRQRLHGLVYCAVRREAGFPVKILTPALLHEIMTVNFYAYAEITRSFVKCARKSGVRMVGLSSMASRSNGKSLAAYASSKAAMEAFTRVFASEIAPTRSTINTISPAFVKTSLVSGIGLFHSDSVEEFERDLVQSGKIPLGFISPDDVASMVLYVLSDAAKSITGTNIVINAGAASPG